jgi:AraC-like DNA-binding protein
MMMKLDVKSTRNRKIIDLRKYDFSDLQVLGKYNYQKSEGKLKDHKHEGMIEICYYDKGSQYFVVNREQYLVKGGEAFIHFPHEIHGSGNHLEMKGTLYWLIIKLDKNELNHTTILCNHLIQKGIRHFKVGKDLKKWLEDIFIIHDSAEPSPLKKVRINLMIQAFILRLIDYAANQRQDTAHERLNKVLYFIEKNLTQHISMRDLAAELNISESRFKIVFKELMGFTPGDYIQRRKVDIAIDKIKDSPGISLTDLAYDLNFSSPQYFSTVIRKYTGESPSSIKSKYLE